MSWFGLSVTARFEPVNEHKILMFVRYDDIETLQLLYDSSDHEIANSLRILQRSKFVVDKYSIEILATHLNKRRMTHAAANQGAAALAREDGAARAVPRARRAGDGRVHLKRRSA